MNGLNAKVDVILTNYAYRVEDLLPILLEVQDISEGRLIATETSQYIADQIKIPYTQISEVLSFFAAFNESNKGKYHIEMCNSTVCRLNGKGPIELKLEELLDIKVGETTEDNMFTLDYAPCFGACDTSPSVRINKKVYGNLTAEKITLVIDKLRGAK